MKIIAVDPGFERLGIAIIEKESRGKEVLLFSECFKTSANLPFEERLLLIGNEISKLIGEYSPEALSIETLFFTNNQKTAMHVAETRGAIIYEALKNGLQLFEFNPVQIKAAVTGSGRADKKQVISMIHKLIVIKNKLKHDDEYDAIACGLTFFAYQKSAYPQA